MDVNESLLALFESLTCHHDVLRDEDIVRFLHESETHRINEDLHLEEIVSALLIELGLERGGSITYRQVDDEDEVFEERRHY